MSKLAILILLPVVLLAQAFVQQTTDRIVVGNSYFSLEFEKKADRLFLRHIVNKVSGNRYAPQNGIFKVTVTYRGEDITPPRNTPAIWSTADFKFVGMEERQSVKTIKEVWLRFEGHGLQVDLGILIPEKQPWLKTQLKIQDLWKSGTFIEKVDVLNLQLPGMEARFGGFGQPVFTRDLFFGVEFPAAYTVVEKNNTVRAWHYVSQRLDSTTVFVSHAAVIGFCAFDAVQPAFYQYIRSFRPRPDRPFALYNTWYDIRDFSYARLQETIKAFKTTLIDRYGLKLDAFVIDDGWDDLNSVWEIDERKFPQGFAPLRKALKEMGSHLGLWISPWNGYGKARDQRVDWATSHGFKTSGRHLCLGDDAYFKIFKQKTLQYLKDADLSFYKIDGFLSVCNQTDHNHLPGIYSRQFLTTRFVEVLKALRAARPDIFIDITVGTWLSPWWLKYADAVWMTGADYGHAEDVPAFSERDKAITFRDFTLYKDFVRDQLQFPLSNVMTHGIIKGKLNLLGGKDETLQNWMDNAVMYFARGVMMWELYLSPEVLTRDEWDFLAAVMKWAYQNQHILKNSRFLGGNPYARQVYGYVHQLNDEALVILRNPYVKPQETVLNWRQIFQQPLKTGWRVEELYPINKILNQTLSEQQDLRVTLQGYEVKVLRLKPVKAFPPLPSGVSLVPEKISSRQAEYLVYFDPKAGDDSHFVSPEKIKSLKLNKVSITAEQWKQLLEKAREEQSKKESKRFSFNLRTFSSQKIEGAIEMKGNALLNGRLAILMEFEQPVSSLKVKSSAEDFDVKMGAKGSWYWVLFPETDDISVQFEIAPAGQVNFPRGRMSVWEIGQKQLIKLGVLQVKTRKPIFKSMFQIPTSADRVRQTVPIYEAPLPTKN